MRIAVADNIPYSMEVRAYTDQDWEEVSMWYIERNLNPIPRKFLPSVGAIVPGIGCAYMYQTDGNFVILENCITNPRTTHEQRKEALDVIVASMLTTAPQLGFGTAIAFTTHPTVEHGCRDFQACGTYKMFSKEIR